MPTKMEVLAANDVEYPEICKGNSNRGKVKNFCWGSWGAAGKIRLWILAYALVFCGEFEAVDPEFFSITVGLKAITSSSSLSFTVATPAAWDTAFSNEGASSFAQFGPICCKTLSSLFNSIRDFGHDSFRVYLHFPRTSPATPNSIKSASKYIPYLPSSIESATSFPAARILWTCVLFLLSTKCIVRMQLREIWSKLCWGKSQKSPVQNHPPVQYPHFHLMTFLIFLKRDICNLTSQTICVGIFSVNISRVQKFVQKNTSPSRKNDLVPACFSSISLLVAVSGLHANLP